MIQTKWFQGRDGIKESAPIRLKVFVEEQGVPEEIEMDENDEFADHVVIYENSHPVATGRVIHLNGQFLIGRVAVLKDYRGKGYGDLGVRMLVRKAFDQGASEVHLHAQVKVQRFYEKIGFMPYGRTYQEAGIEHINMIMKEDVKGSCRE